VNYVDADKVVLRLTRREVREVLLALASRTSNLVLESDAAESAYHRDEAAKYRKSSQIAAKVHERIKRASQTKWSGVAL
jgi:hypothetical protein